mmetsp:Transcript_24344/g.75750  ORF Transcript_24344/g.75750 Transcript_24344/m.75750 type:complete len:289 (-) Transcript_24344:1573-2439(-)
MCWRHPGPHLLMCRAPHRGPRPPRATEVAMEGVHRVLRRNDRRHLLAQGPSHHRSAPPALAAAPLCRGVALSGRRTQQSQRPRSAGRPQGLVAGLAASRRGDPVLVQPASGVAARPRVRSPHHAAATGQPQAAHGAARSADRRSAERSRGRPPPKTCTSWRSPCCWQIAHQSSASRRLAWWRKRCAVAWGRTDGRARAHRCAAPSRHASPSLCSCSCRPERTRTRVTPRASAFCTQLPSMAKRPSASCSCKPRATQTLPTGTGRHPSSSHRCATSVRCSASTAPMSTS